jgi:cellulose synthase/poly-beta-1,6-N-acetylglucosamine synthase-like glycosyltransferase
LISAGLSIVIPVGYDPVGLEITLSSLDNDYNFEQEIIVINDGADPEVSIVCKKYNVKEIKLKTNVGPAKGRNKAVEISEYEFIAFLDADVRVSDNWAISMFNALQVNDYVAGDIIIDPNLIDGFFHEYDSITAFDIESYMNAGHGVTANLGVRKCVFNKLGGFNSSLRSGEDLEFGDRVTMEDSFKTALCKDALAFHPPRSLKAQINKRKRVVQGHLYLSSMYPERYLKYKKIYSNPIKMIRPTLKFQKIVNKYSSSWKYPLYFLYSYFLKLYSFYCARKYLSKPEEIILEVKDNKK